LARSESESSGALSERLARKSGKLRPQLVGDEALVAQELQCTRGGLHDVPVLVLRERGDQLEHARRIQRPEAGRSDRVVKQHHALGNGELREVAMECRERSLVDGAAIVA